MSLLDVLTISVPFAATLFVGLRWLYDSYREKGRLFDRAAARLDLHNTGTGSDPILRGKIRNVDVVVRLDLHRSSAFEVTASSAAFPRLDVMALVRDRIVLPDVEPVENGLARTVSKRLEREDDVVKPVEETVATAERVLCSPISVWLLDNVRNGPDAEVRLKSLQALLDHYREDGSTRSALPIAAADRDPRLRRIAALELGGAVEKAFASSASTPPAMRLEALERLARKLPYSKLSKVVAAALDAPDDALRIGALQLVAEARDRELASKVASLGPAASGPLGGAVMKALEALDACDESALLPLLGNPSEDVRRSAAKALARGGTLRAVEALLEAEKAGGSSGEAARDAIRAIQGRHAGAEAGGVSLVPGVAGSGAVSVARKKERA